MAHETVPSMRKKTVSPPLRLIARKPSRRLCSPQMNKEVLEVLKEGERDKKIRLLRHHRRGTSFLRRTGFKRPDAGAERIPRRFVAREYNPMIRQIRQMEKIVIAAALTGSPPEQVVIWRSPVTSRSLPKRQTSLSPLCASVWRRTPVVVLSAAPRRPEQSHGVASTRRDRRRA